jgi:hypothetical protein
MKGEIKTRLELLEKALRPKAQVVTVELPDGSKAQKPAAEWWEHRREWPLASFDDQDNSGGLALLLVFADMFDHGIEEARGVGDTTEVERLTAERDDMLQMYFGRPEKP